MYSIYYTCNVKHESKPEMAAWADELFEWLREQNFVFHRSWRNAGIDSPDLVAYFDFNDEASAQEFWGSPGCRDMITRMRKYTTDMREHRLLESPLTGLGVRGVQKGDANYTILYTCDVDQSRKPEMAAWTAELLPWLATQNFIYHRSTRNAGIDSPELMAYFDFADEESGQAFWSSKEWKDVMVRFNSYTSNQKEIRLAASPLSGYGITGKQEGPMAR